MRPIKRFLSFCLAASLSSSALAQPRVYFDFKGPSENLVMTVDDKDYEPSFWTGFLSSREAFRSNPEAYRLMEEAYNHQVTGSYLFWGLGIVTPITFLTTTGNSGLSFGTRSSIYWGTFLGGFISGIYFQGLAGKKFLKGLNTYNGVYGTQGAASHWELMPILGQEPGLALSLKF